MARIGFCADVHIGNHRQCGGVLEVGINQRCRYVLETLARMYERAAALEVDTIIIAGDLFDHARPSPQMIAATQRVLSDAENAGIVTVIITGNHDMVSECGDDHALGPMAPLAHVYEHPTTLSLDDHTRLHLLPYMSGPVAEWMPQTLVHLLEDAPDGMQHVLCFHAGITDSTTAPWLRDSDGAVPVGWLAELMRKHGIRWALAGDWHDHRKYCHERALICQIGALAPTGWDNPSEMDGSDGYGKLVIVNTDDERSTFQVETITGPRFFTTAPSTADVHQLRMRSRWNGHQLFVRWQVASHELEGARAEMRALLDKHIIEGGLVLPRVSHAEAQQRVAIQNTQHALGLDEAVYRYVQSMDVPPDLNRDAVVASALSYLKSAGATP